MNLFEDALTSCEELIKLAPNLYANYMLKGEVTYYLNMLKDSIDAYSVAIKLLKQGFKYSNCHVNEKEDLIACYLN